eukprot:1002577-Prymnesium_polylepis.3
MEGFGQFATTSQFYLYGRKHCTQTGYNRVRQKLLQAGPDPLDAVDLSGRVAMVTGANSGCGFEIASFLARKGATVYMVCRSAKRGEEARQKIAAESGNEDVHLLTCDVSLEADTRAIWTAFCAARADDGVRPRLDVLRTLTSEGVETTLACHLVRRRCRPAAAAQHPPFVAPFRSTARGSTAGVPPSVAPCPAALRHVPAWHARDALPRGDGGRARGGHLVGRH